MSSKKQRIIQAIKNGQIKDQKSLEFWLMMDEIKNLNLVKDLEKKLEKFLDDVVMLKGEKGDTPTDAELLRLIKPLIPPPAKGDEGKPGKDGKTPTKEELLTIIKPLIESINVPKAEDVAKLVPIPQVPTIEEITKNIPIEAERIRDSLELLTGEERLSASAIKDLPEFADKIIQTGGGRGLWLYTDGDKRGLVDRIDFIGATYSKVNGRPTLTFQGDTDELVKLNADDPTAGYLDDKISGYGFLTTETDPVFSTWLSGVSPSNWDTAYGWGNHASEGYAKYSFGANNFLGTGNFVTTGTGTFGKVYSTKSSQNVWLDAYDAGGLRSINADGTLYYKIDGTSVGFTSSSLAYSAYNDKPIRLGQSGSNYGQLQYKSSTDEFEISTAGTTKFNLNVGDITFTKQADQSIIKNARTTDGNGYSLTITAGGAGTGGNMLGGDLSLSAGYSRGNVGSSIKFYTATPSFSGVTIRTPSLKWVIDGNGNLLAGTSGTDTFNISTYGIGTFNQIKFLSPLTNGSVSGETISWTANQNVAFGDLAYVNSSGKLAIANATGISTAKVVAIATQTIYSSQSGIWLLKGFIRYDFWNWTAGEYVYLSKNGTTGNTLTQTPPEEGDTNACVVIVGIAMTSKIIYFNPSLQGIIELR